jgi:hypothetical protein
MAVSGLKKTQKKDKKKENNTSNIPEDEAESSKDMEKRWKHRENEDGRYTEDTEIGSPRECLELAFTKVFKGEKTTFDPNTRNGITGKPFNKSHYAAGEGAKTKSSDDDGVYAFCLKHVTYFYKGIPFRCRCEGSMLVDSDPCSKHGKAVYKDGANQVREKLLKPDNKYRVTYGDI